MTFEQRKAEALHKLESFFRPRVVDHDASPDQRLRNRIEAAKARAAADQNANEGENLKDLRRRHYERTRSDGG